MRSSSQCRSFYVPILLFSLAFIVNSCKPTLPTHPSGISPELEDFDVDLVLSNLNERMISKIAEAQMETNLKNVSNLCPGEGDILHGSHNSGDIRDSELDWLNKRSDLEEDHAFSKRIPIIADSLPLKNAAKDKRVSTVRKKKKSIKPGQRHPYPQQQVRSRRARSQTKNRTRSRTPSKKRISRSPPKKKTTIREGEKNTNVTKKPVRNRSPVPAVVNDDDPTNFPLTPCYGRKSNSKNKYVVFLPSNGDSGCPIVATYGKILCEHENHYVLDVFKGIETKNSKNNWRFIRPKKDWQTGKAYKMFSGAYNLKTRNRKFAKGELISHEFFDDAGVRKLKIVMQRNILVKKNTAPSIVEFKRVLVNKKCPDKHICHDYKTANKRALYENRQFKREIACANASRKGSAKLVPRPWEIKRNKLS